MDFTDAGDGRDEGKIEIAGEPLHFGERQFEGDSHVLAGHVAGSKDKFADCMFFKGALFEKVVTDALIRGQQDPPL